MEDKIKMSGFSVLWGTLIAILIVLAILILFFYPFERDRRERVTGEIKVLAANIQRGVEVEQNRRELIRIIDGNREFDAGYALGALADTGDISKETLDCLLRTMKRSEGSVLDREAAIALGDIRPVRDDIIDELIRKLDSNWDVSVFSAEALGKIGAGAKRALPKLRERMLSNNTLLAEQCRKAIELITRDDKKTGTH